jgi:outer membrane protein OmpA-like peptidoglycan-associated protein
MFSRKRMSGFMAAAGLALWPFLSTAWAEERMQLGAPAGPAAEFQTQVGDRVFFSEGSAELGARARTALEAQAAWLTRNTSLAVTIEGHADDSRLIDSDVSRRRAEAVRRRLIEKGVAAERIEIVAYGRDRPIAECGAPGCAAQNRRAVTVVGAPRATALPRDASELQPGDTAMKRSPRRLY